MGPQGVLLPTTGHPLIHLPVFKYLIGRGWSQVGIWIILVLSKKGREAAEPGVCLDSSSCPSPPTACIWWRCCFSFAACAVLLALLPWGPKVGARFWFCVERDVPSCRIMCLQCFPLWPQFAWGCGGSAVPCCSGCFPDPSAHSWCVWAASAHTVLPEIKLKKSFTLLSPSFAVSWFL